MSEQKKYTPGPWDQRENSSREIMRDSGNTRQVTGITIQTKGLRGLDRKIIGAINVQMGKELADVLKEYGEEPPPFDYVNYPLEEATANADLMKASPEMFEALEKFLEGWEHFCNCLDFKNTFLDAAAIAWMNDCPIEVAKAINSANGIGK